MSIQPDQISVILTSTIDVRGIANMQRTDVQARLDDYRRALQRWLDDPWTRHLVMVENSGYPLDDLRGLVARHPSGKDVEFLSFDGQDFPRSRGKGFGEMTALRHVLRESAQLRRTGRFLKVNGRYFIPNIADVLACMQPETAVFCNITKSLSYSDSRVFGGDLQFLELLCEQGLRVDDEAGYWFEHALCRSALLAIADGRPWQFMRRLPVVEGYSGTLNRPYSESRLKLWVKGRGHALKQRLLSL
ncbi:MAG TPA: hypothetical protein VIP05_24085 [Burkholderiaceae bacterium]